MKIFYTPEMYNGLLTVATATVEILTGSRPAVATVQVRSIKIL
jgi:hypothetical protein